MTEQAAVYRLAEKVVDLSYESLSASVVEATKQAILEQIGIMLVGAQVPWTAPVRELAALSTSQVSAQLVGTTDRAPFLDAIMANSTFGHACEFDDSGYQGAAHPGALTVPTALSLAEAHRLSAKDVITSVVAGYQVLFSLGRIMTRMLQKLGFHPQSVIGPFGAAATAGKLLALPTGTLATALSIAGSHASGTQEFADAGGNVKRYHSGMAARAGTVSVLLARSGLTAPMTILEGERGLLKLITRLEPTAEPEIDWDEGGTVPYAIERRMVKWYPVVGSAQTGVEAIEHLMDEHRLSGEDVAKVDVYMNPHGLTHGPNVDGIEDSVQAQFSLPFSVALRLVTGKNDVRDYMRPETWRDEKILSIARRVNLHGDESYASGQGREGWERFWGCRMIITLKDGRQLTREEPFRKGSHLNPVSKADLRDKFMGLASPVVGEERAAKIAELVDGLERLESIESLMAHTRVATR